MRIGKTIKKLRLQAGLTQEELANRANLTKGFISQVENDATSPSIATLQDIVSALGVTLGDFFKSDAPPAKVVYTSTDWVVSGDSETGFEFTFLIPRAHLSEMEPVLVRLDPGKSTEPSPGHGGEEFGYVLDGQVELNLGGVVHRARKGECFHYPASAGHFLANRGRRAATVLWISTPPSF